MTQGEFEELGVFELVLKDLLGLLEDFVSHVRHHVRLGGAIAKESGGWPDDQKAVRMNWVVARTVAECLWI